VFYRIYELELSLRLMSTFYTLLQKNIGVTACIYSHNGAYDYWAQIVKTDLQTLSANPANYFIHTYIARANELTTQASVVRYGRVKFQCLAEILERVNDKFYMGGECQDYIITVFSRAQRTYRAFSRLARLWKVQRSAYRVDHDLSLMPIDPRSKTSITIFQDGAKYLFKLTDLINIIHSSLSHSPQFFTDPLFPKNPYTNMQFTEAMLYEIYFAILRSNYTVPTLLHLFYKSNFDLDDFYYDNEAIIRDIHIKDFAKNASSEDLYPFVKIMLKTMDKNKKIKIDDEFPKDKLVNIMRPYLLLYLQNVYSISHTDKKYRAYFVLHKKIRKFCKYNPSFGRKVFVRVKIGRIRKYVPSFDDKHINFYEKDQGDTNEEEEEEEEAEAEADAIVRRLFENNGVNGANSTGSGDMDVDDDEEDNADEYYDEEDDDL